MSYEGNSNMYFIQKGGELMGAGHAVLESCADPMRLEKKLFEIFRLPEIYETMWLQVFMA